MPGSVRTLTTTVIAHLGQVIPLKKERTKTTCPCTIPIILFAFAQCFSWQAGEKQDSGNMACQVVTTQYKRPTFPYRYSLHILLALLKLIEGFKLCCLTVTKTEIPYPFDEFQKQYISFPEQRRSQCDGYAS